jgi:hypothetical protein
MSVHEPPLFSMSVHEPPLFNLSVHEPPLFNMSVYEPPLFNLSVHEPPLFKTSAAPISHYYGSPLTASRQLSFFTCYCFFFPSREFLSDSNTCLQDSLIVMAGAVFISPVNTRECA